MTDHQSLLGSWTSTLAKILEDDDLCPSPRDLDSWAVITHHLHANLLDDPSVFPSRKEFAKQDLARIGRLASSVSKRDRRTIFEHTPYPPMQSKFRFIDLFAGLGGFRIALQGIGGKAVFSSELNASARMTYAKNFGDVPFGDIRLITRAGERFRRRTLLNALIPDFDVVAAGFPCQPFSLAGVSSRRHHGLNEGLQCTDQGTLFDDILAIVRAKDDRKSKPKILFLENVRNLLHHDGGQTFKIIWSRIDACGYEVFPQVIDSQSVVPQRRKRIFLVCIRKDLVKSIGPYRFPKFPIPDPPLPLKSILDRREGLEEFQISTRLWESHQMRSKRHAQRGNGFTIELANLKRPANTLVSRYYKDGKDCLISMGEGRNPRMLTPQECAKLQGFDPEVFVLPDSRTAAYRAFGNAVTVPVVERIARSLVRYLK